MRLRLLVDAAEFHDAVAADLASARRSAFVQALTFEGDAAGQEMAGLLAASPAADRRVLIDEFTRHVLSDRFRWWPRNLVSVRLWAEAFATGRMVRGMRRQGALVRFLNPAGPCFHRFAARNHKKLVAVDGRVAYVGGINFSDHNFAWHDLMLRIEDGQVAGFLHEDFLATWAGHDEARTLRIPGLALHSLDGRRNEEAFEEVLDLLAAARHDVFLECPYVTDPFSRELARAARRGVRVRIVTAEKHNFPLLREALVQAAASAPLHLRLYPGRMTHLKALLVDGRRLVLGSANLDVWSYRSQQEYLLVASEPALIEDFRRRVMEPDLACSSPLPPGGAGDERGSEARLAGLALLASLGARARRGMP
jgi:cardiolipin synthase A/B